MTTLENTISMMEKLPETDLIEIQNLTKNSSANTNPSQLMPQLARF